MGWDDESRRWGDDPADHRELDRWLTRSREEAWGEPIDSYSRADAIADGVLVDVTPAARELGIALPVAFTSGAHAELVGDDAEQLRVVLAAVVSAMVESPAERVDLVLRGREAPVACWATVGEGDE